MSEQQNLVTQLSGWGLQRGPDGIGLEFLSFRVVCELGDGGSSRVFGVEGADGRRFALKLGRHGFSDVLVREAKVLALTEGLGVPRLETVIVSDVGEVGLVVEWLEGKSLRQLSLEELALPGLAGSVWLEAHQVVAGLHELGYVHGDLQPGNIFLSGGRAVLLDFGLATERDGSERALGLSPEFAAPELLSSGKSTPESDAYSLARTVVSVFGSSALDLSPWLEPSPERRARLPSPSQSAAALQSALLRTRRPFLEADVAGLVPILRQARVQLECAGQDEFVKELLQPVVFRLLAADLAQDLLSCGLPQDAPAGTRTIELPGLGHLSGEERVRLLGFLVGPSAMSFHIELGDEALWQKLLRCAEAKPLEALTQGDLSGEPAVEPEASDPIELMSKVVSGTATLGTLERILETVALPWRLQFEAARVARRRDASVLAHRLLDAAELKLGAPDQGESRFQIAAERALVLRRQGHVDHALGILDMLPPRFWERSSAPWVAQALGLLGRISLDRGDEAGAETWAQKGASEFPCREVLALVQLARGRPSEAQDELELRGSVPTDDEGRARFHALRAMAHQASGSLELAASCFERAVESAVRAGAVLEEATYLTGLASVASDTFRSDAALSAAERASALFEVLGRPAQAARALLAKAAVFGRLGLEHELKETVIRARLLALQGGDLRCLGYLELCLVDGLSDASLRTRSLAEARAYLVSGDDRLRVAARELEFTGKMEARGNLLARGSEVVEVQLEWWKARAVAAQKWGASEDLAEVISEILRVGAMSSSATVGPASLVAAELALEQGQAELARRLFARAAELGARAISGLPARYRERGLHVDWVKMALSRKVSSVSEAQLSDVEALLRALSHRDGLRPLLRQFLDLLLLWTGVERGILLLKAPGGRLVVRLGRNLRRTDLSPEQLRVSQSLAARALDERRAIALTEGTPETEQLHKSVHFLKLRSVLAVPLMAGGETFGVAYLDDKVKREAFGEAEIAWASLIASIAAIAVRDVRDRLLLRRATRRAERASSKLEGTLHKREESIEVLERRLREDERTGTGDAEFGIVYESRSMHTLLGQLRKVAQSDVPILVLGESGSGKELIARAVHQAGRRVKAAFVAENCAALPENLLESELFGHVRGAFTGATRDRPGLFELADGGTLFLDEVGEMSLPMQAKLLRVLQDGTVRRVGADKPRRVDVRLIAATHRSLSEWVRQGKFREDLFYRLDVVSLQVPPLRERREDVLPLVRYFLAKYAPERVVRIAPGAARELIDFDWPGNVRQLENEVRRLLIFIDREITAADLSPRARAVAPVESGPGTLREKVDALERALVLSALDAHRGNKTQMADALGLSRHGLLKMMKRLGLDESV